MGSEKLSSPLSVRVPEMPLYVHCQLRRKVSIQTSEPEFLEWNEKRAQSFQFRLSWRVYSASMTEDRIMAVLAFVRQGHRSEAWG